MVDFAHQMRWLVDEAYPEAEKIRVVLDNLNIHKPASLYQAFRPDEARRIRKRLEFHYTPKHGSWLNMAEIEFSVFSRQCLARRIGDEDTLKREIAALEAQRNNAQATIDWRFSTVDARVKLKRVYPSVSTGSGTSVVGVGVSLEGLLLILAENLSCSGLNLAIQTLLPVEVSQRPQDSVNLPPREPRAGRHAELALHVVLRVEQYAACPLLVPSSAARLLQVVLQGAWDIGVDDQAHVRLVDAHAEGVGGDDGLQSHRG